MDPAFMLLATILAILLEREIQVEAHGISVATAERGKRRHERIEKLVDIGLAMAGWDSVVENHWSSRLDAKIESGFRSRGQGIFC